MEESAPFLEEVAVARVESEVVGRGERVRRGSRREAVPSRGQPASAGPCAPEQVGRGDPDTIEKLLWRF